MYTACSLPTLNVPHASKNSSLSCGRVINLRLAVLKMYFNGDESCSIRKGRRSPTHEDKGSRRRRRGKRIVLRVRMRKGEELTYWVFFAPRAFQALHKFQAKYSENK